MTPEQALELLLSTTSIARLTESDRDLCKHAYAVIRAALAPPPRAPAKKAKRKAAKTIKKAPRITKKGRTKKTAKKTPKKRRRK